MWRPVNKPRPRKSGFCLQDVEEAISELQKELFRRQGIDGDWGLHCLGRINTEHRGMRISWPPSTILSCGELRQTQGTSPMYTKAADQPGSLLPVVVCCQQI